MPNICKNRMTVLGTDADVKAFVMRAVASGPNYPPTEWDIRRAKDAGKDPYAPPPAKLLQFHAFIPIPDAVIAKGYSPAGYDAECDLWGTKWGAFDTKLETPAPGCAVYSFETAWAPPTQFLETISRELPGLTFLLSFDEESPHRGRFVVCRGIVNILASDKRWPDGECTCCEPDWAQCAHCKATEAYSTEYVTTHDAWANEERAIRERQASHAEAE
jgi:hypothetical protein